MSIEKITNYGIDPEQAKRIYNGLISYRGYGHSFMEYPDSFLKELMSDTHDSNQLYLPLEVVELTPFLVGGKAFGDFLLFDMKFIKKQFKAYPIYIELEVPGDLLMGKGAFYTEDNELLKYCKSIFINADSEHSESSKKAINIINELSELSTHTLIDIPAMTRKEASIFDLHKYRIYIDDIHDDSNGEIVWAKDVRQALERVATKYPEAEKIIAMYYKNSPFINKPGFTIKKESALKKQAESLSIQLETTPNQAKIIEFIRKGLEQYGQNLNGWVVGGYVRDSLMGKKSDDLDVAISSAATGLDFAQFLKDMGSKMDSDPTGKIYSTALDKTDTGSDQLQVAALEIYGEKIDFVNLRTEQYSDDSRVPVQATTDNPEEDAMRRDLTINSLYYNIKDSQIEDYVGAINDFERTPDGNFAPKTLRTPADPASTFIDDPLRMLRVLRFYSRYDGVEIAPNVIEAFKNPQVLETYDKLAPERASKEIRKMMEGSQAVDATKILLETGLYKKVFNMDETWHDIDMDQQSPYHQYNLMDHTISVMRNYNEIAKRKGVEGDERALMLLATLLHDFGKMHPEIRKQKFDRKTGEPVVFDRDGEPVDRYSYERHEQASSEFAQNIMNQMGFAPEEKKFVGTVVQNHMLPHNFDKSMKDKTIGKFLNKVEDLYEHIMDHGEADALSKGEISEEERQQIMQQRQQNMQKLVEYRDRMQNLIHKPIINGNEVMAIADSVAPELGQNKAMIQAKGYGKPVFYVKIIMDKLLQQQWAGNVVDKQQAENFVRSQSKQIFNIWNQQQKEQAKQAALDNAVKKQMKLAALDDSVKKAQHLGEESHAVFLEGDPPGTKEQGYQTLNRGIKVNFNVGDVVKQRNKGYNFKQKQGRVEKIKDNIMTVKWEDGKTTEYPMLDSSKIFRELEKDV